jgi:uncharacterized protein (TIGR02145 family)
MYLGMSESECNKWAIRGTDEGYKLKSTQGWNGLGTDAYGFCGLPGGYYSWWGGFQYKGEHAYFWTATEGGADKNAYARALQINVGGICWYEDILYSGMSVRCVKD